MEETVERSVFSLMFKTSLNLVPVGEEALSGFSGAQNT